MPPKFNKERSPETHQTIEENTERYQRQEEERKDAWSDGNEEEDNSSQFSRGIMRAQEENRLVESNTSSMAEDASTEEQTCQLSSSDRRISFMDQIRKTFGCLPSVFSNLKRSDVASHAQQGSLSGVPLAPVLEGTQQSYLKSSMRSRSIKMEEASQRSAKIVTFQLEDLEQPVAGEDEEATLQDLERGSFPGQEKIEQYSSFCAASTTAY